MNIPCRILYNVPTVEAEDAGFVEKQPATAGEDVPPAVEQHIALMQKK